MIKQLGLVLALVLAVAAMVGLRWLGGALDVATGYSAKQLCSGVFVAGLPPDFVFDNDIRLSLEVMGPALDWMDVDIVDTSERRSVTTSLLGSRSSAIFTQRKGCVLNPPDPDAIAWKATDTVWNYLPYDQVPGSNPLQRVLDAAFAEPADGQRRTLAVVVKHRGEVIAERYAAPVDSTTPLQGWSMNKSLLATWVGLLVERGELSLQTSVRDAVAELEPALAENVDPALNLGHLLHMESGFRFEETYFPGDDATRMLYRSPAMWRVAPGNGHAFAPGEHWSYSSGDTNLAAKIWTGALQGKDYEQWLNLNFRRLLEATEAGPMASEPDASGIQVSSSYTYMPARAWSAVGQFWLDAWHGRRDEISQQWMRESVTPRPANTQGNYGRSFWLNTLGDQFPGLPKNLFYASGHNSQYVMVFPDQELVVVRLGLSSGGYADGAEALFEGVLANLPE